jgi:hypothetical protein
VLGESSITNTLSCPSCGGTRGLQHWDTNSIAADPLLVTTGANYLVSNVNLQSGSPSRGIAQDLSSLVPYLPNLNVGFNGNTQIAGSWDMGAMPYGSGSTNTPARVVGVTLQGDITLEGLHTIGQ